MEPDFTDILAAMELQRNTALREAAMNWALCRKQEKRISELEAENAALKEKQ
jgi:hypothetical protein